MNEKTITVPKISCGHCVAAIKDELLEIDGVKLVDGDPATKKVIVRFDAPANWDNILKVLIDIGYPAEE